MVLCSSYVFRNWRKILTLITAFTLGHSITLALSVLHWISFSSNWVEVLIPVTIALTALNNIRKNKTNSGFQIPNYVWVIFFGFIHGMGFASALRSLLGHQNQIFIPLLAFNLGLEAGQLVVVSIVLLISFLITKLSRLPQAYWNEILSWMIFFIALILLYIRIHTTNLLHFDS